MVLSAIFNNESILWLMRYKYCSHSWKTTLLPQHFPRKEVLRLRSSHSSYQYSLKDLSNALSFRRVQLKVKSFSKNNSNVSTAKMEMYKSQLNELFIPVQIKYNFVSQIGEHYFVKVSFLHVQMLKYFSSLRKSSLTVFL